MLLKRRFSQPISRLLVRLVETLEFVLFALQIHADLLLAGAQIPLLVMYSTSPLSADCKPLANSYMEWLFSGLLTGRAYVPKCFCQANSRMNVGCTRWSRNAVPLFRLRPKTINFAYEKYYDTNENIISTQKPEKRNQLLSVFLLK